MKKTIYIAGPITGTENFEWKFQVAENRIKSFFPNAEIKNPVKFCGHLDPEETSWGRYMEECIVHLKQSTHIHLLDGWQDSKGATVEYYLARILNLSFV